MKVTTWKIGDRIMVRPLVSVPKQFHCQPGAVEFVGRPVTGPRSVVRVKFDHTKLYPNSWHYFETTDLVATN